MCYDRGQRELVYRNVALRASSMKPPVFGVSSVCAVFLVWTLFSVPWGSSYPLEGGTGSPQLRFVEEFDRFRLGFSWLNMSCAVCKAIFATLDIALLVRHLLQLVVVGFKLPWLSCRYKCRLIL